MRKTIEKELKARWQKESIYYICPDNPNLTVFTTSENIIFKVGNEVQISIPYNSIDNFIVSYYGVMINGGYIASCASL